MLREKRIIDFLDSYLSFSSEDELEIKFHEVSAKAEVSGLALTLYNELDFNFLLNINDEHTLMLPDEFSEIESILRFIPKDEVNLVVTLKKADIISSHEFINTLIFYNMDNLSNHLSNLDFWDFQSYIFSNKSKVKIILINESPEILFQNDFIWISNLTDDTNHENFNNDNVEILKPKDKFKKLSSGVFSTATLVPEQLKIENDLPIKSIFDKWCSLLSLAYLSYFSEIQLDKNTFSFYFQGQKKIQLTLKPNHSFSIDELYDFYKWIYSDKTEDKLKIFHNLLPLYTNNLDEIGDKQFFNVLPKIITSTKENFNFFIQDNIKIFVEERKKIEEMVTSTGNIISGEINKITDLLVKTLSGIFISVLTSLLAILLRVQLQNYISYALYLFSGIIFTSFLFVLIFSIINVNISNKLFNTRISEYEYLFDYEKQKSIKKSIRSRNQAFWASIIITTIIFLLILVLLISLGMYFQNQGNGVIDFLKNSINKHTLKN